MSFPLLPSSCLQHVAICCPAKDLLRLRVVDVSTKDVLREQANAARRLQQLTAERLGSLVQHGMFHPSLQGRLPVQIHWDFSLAVRPRSWLRHRWNVDLHHRRAQNENDMDVFAELHEWNGGREEVMGAWTFVRINLTHWYLMLDLPPRRRRRPFGFGVRRPANGLVSFCLLRCEMQSFAVFVVCYETQTFWANPELLIHSDSDSPVDTSGSDSDDGDD